jgi:hypothetical protein
MTGPVAHTSCLGSFSQENEGEHYGHEPISARYAPFSQSDFMPPIRQEQTQGSEERPTYADEFAACHLGQIDKKLGRSDRVAGAKHPSSLIACLSFVDGDA